MNRPFMMNKHDENIEKLRTIYKQSNTYHDQLSHIRNLPSSRQRNKVWNMNQPEPNQGATELEVVQKSNQQEKGS